LNKTVAVTDYGNNYHRSSMDYTVIHDRWFPSVK